MNKEETKREYIEEVKDIKNKFANILHAMRFNYCDSETFEREEKFNEAVETCSTLYFNSLSKQKKEDRLKTLKELVAEFQSNELEGKGYDFYFAIRTKIDDLI